MTEPLSTWVVTYTEYRQKRQKIVLARTADHAEFVFRQQRRVAAERLNKPYLATHYTFLKAERLVYER